MNSEPTGKKARTRQRILQAASKGVRRAGFHGVGVAEVMKEVGLTHGGFYSHFPSKDALLAEALAQASQDIGGLITENVQALSKRGQTRFSAFVETYLSNRQINDCENGCPVAALCGQMPGQSDTVLESSQQIIANLHRLVQNALPDGVHAQAAWTVTSTIVGAMQLARALGDNSQGRAVLAAARADLISCYDQQA